MKVKQKSIRSFEFTLNGPEETADALEYVEQNREILQNFLLVLKGDPAPALHSALEEQGFQVLSGAGSLVGKERSKELADVHTPSEKASRPEPETPAGTLTHYTPVRSGTELECEEDVILFGRVNSGAKVIAKKNAIIFSPIDGIVEAHGEYVVTRGLGAGQLLFHHERVDPGRLEGRLHKVRMKDSGLVYEEL